MEATEKGKLLCFLFQEWPVIILDLCFKGLPDIIYSVIFRICHIV